MINSLLSIKSGVKGMRKEHAQDWQQCKKSLNPYKPVYGLVGISLGHAFNMQPFCLAQIYEFLADLYGRL